MESPDCYLGLSLGQAQEYSALALVERPPVVPLAAVVLAVRHLERFPPGTGYPQIVAAVTALASNPSLERARLLVDVTGVGQAVGNLLRTEPLYSRLLPVVITGGHTVTTGTEGTRYVPKKELVASVQVLLQQGRLKIAQSLSAAAILLDELRTFQVRHRVDAAVLDGREGPQDDLVFAVALACWQAGQEPRWEPPTALKRPGASLRERAAGFLGERRPSRERKGRHP
jgi:hypothetical protein